MPAADQKDCQHLAIEKLHIIQYPVTGSLPKIGLLLLGHKDAMYIPEAGCFAAGGTLLLKLYGSLETPATEDMPASQRSIRTLLAARIHGACAHEMVRAHMIVLLTV